MDSATITSLAETGFTAARSLNHAYEIYRNAPNEVLDLASEVNVCCTLMLSLADSLDDSLLKWNADYSEKLLQNSEYTFKTIRGLVPDGAKADRDFSSKAAFEYNSRRTKEIRQIIVFLQLILTLNARPSRPRHDRSSNDKVEPPIVLKGYGKDALGGEVVYSATLTVQPNLNDQNMKQQSAKGAVRFACDEESRERRLKETLKALRRSPYSSMDLLTTPIDDRSALRRMRSEESKADSNDLLEICSTAEATEEVERLIAAWCTVPVDPERSPRPSRPSLSVADGRSRASSTSKSADQSPAGRPRQPSLSVPEPRSATQSPSPSKSPRHSPSPSPGRTPPTSPRPCASPLHEPFQSQKVPLLIDCEACRRPIRNVRYSCQSCGDHYSLCKWCFGDPQDMIRLRHRHPESHFVEKAVKSLWD